MNRLLSYFNFLGIVVLVGLCIVQWRTNERVELEAVRLERIRLEQAAKLADQKKTIEQLSLDLDDTHQRLSDSQAEVRETKAALAAMTHVRDQLTAEVGRLTDNLRKWQAALAQRDEAIKQAAGEIQKLAKERNDAIGKFNDLAGKYNGIVKQVDDAHGNGRK